MRGDTLSIKTERISVNGRPLGAIVEEVLEFHDAVRVRIGPDFDRVFTSDHLMDFDERLLDMFRDIEFTNGELRTPVLIEPAK